MTPTEKLHAHHERLIGTIKTLAERARKDPADASLLLSFCEEYLISHAEAEEVTLYTADDDVDFVNNMIHEHKEIKHSLDEIDNSFSKGDLNATDLEIRNFMALLTKHFDEEENTLMPKLNKKITDQELEALINQAHQIEGEKKKADVWSLFENDHKRIDLNVSCLRKSTGGSEKLRLYYSKVRKQLLKHIELEETVLFPTFGEHASQNQMGPIQVMIAEHREITSLISIPEDRIDENALLRNVDALIAKLAVHNKKEELILYPMINRTLPRGDRERVFKECYEAFAAV